MTDTPTAQPNERDLNPADVWRKCVANMHGRTAQMLSPEAVIAEALAAARADERAKRDAEIVAAEQRSYDRGRLSERAQTISWLNSPEIKRLLAQESHYPHNKAPMSRRVRTPTADELEEADKAPWHYKQPLEDMSKIWRGRDWVPLDAAIAELQFWQRRDYEHARLADSSAKRDAAVARCLRHALNAANMALFIIRKQGVMPNSSWENEIEKDIEAGKAALDAIESGEIDNG